MITILYGLLIFLLTLILPFVIMRFIPETLVDTTRLVNFLRRHALRTFSVLATVVIFLSMFVLDISSFPYFIRLTYASLCILVIVAICVGFIRYSRTTTGIIQICFVIMSILLLIQIGLGFILGVTSIVDKFNMNLFWAIEMIIILYTYLLFEGFRLIAGNFTYFENAVLYRFITAGVTMYLLSNLFVLMMFGTFNIQNDLVTFETNDISLTHVIYAGSEFFFQFPKIDQSNITLIPLVQYYTGIIFNFIFLPFYISYFASRVSNPQNV